MLESVSCAVRLAVIIPAAGRSTRFAASRPAATTSKLDEDLRGRPLLHWSIAAFDALRRTPADVATSDHRPSIRSVRIIVAGPHDEADLDAFRARHAQALRHLGASICRGGQAERYQSVAAALAELARQETAEACSDEQRATHIAVHDGARPLVSRALIERVLSALPRTPPMTNGSDPNDQTSQTDQTKQTKHARNTVPRAAVPGLPLADTIKRIRSSAPQPSSAGSTPDHSPHASIVLETVDRNGLLAIQTPQVFERTLLERAYAQPDLTSTDDAGLVERLGEPVLVVPGEHRNLKVTTAADLDLIRALFGQMLADSPTSDPHG